MADLFMVSLTYTNKSGRPAAHFLVAADTRAAAMTAALSHEDESDQVAKVGVNNVDFKAVLIEPGVYREKAEEGWTQIINDHPTTSERPNIQANYRERSGG